MSLIKSIMHQLGLSVTPANNFTLDASADNGTMKLARGNAGATTQDIMTVDAAGKVAFPQGQVKQSGEVLQTLIYDGGSVSNISATTPTNIINTLKTFTPKSANSTLILEANCAISGGTPNAGVNLSRFCRMYENNSAGVFGVVGEVGALSGGGTGISPRGMGALLNFLPNNALTPRTFGLAGYVAGSGNASYSNITLKITEVQN